MAVVAHAPAPVELVRSTSAYYAAPVLVDGGVAYLTVPRRYGSPAVVARLGGDRLVLRIGTAARVLADSRCTSAADCAGVLAPSAAGAEVVYGVAADGSGGFIGQAGASGAQRILHADDGGSAVPLVYDGDETRTLWVDGGAIVGAEAPVVAKADTGGEVRAVAASAAGTVWLARAGASGPWRIRAVPAAAPGPVTIAEETRRGVRVGAPVLAADGTVVFSRRVPAGRRRVVFEIVIVRPATGETILAASPAVPVGDRDTLPRVQLLGTTAVYRLRDARYEAIHATDLVTGVTQVLVRKGRRAARISDPTVAGAKTVAWAQTDFRRGAFVRSRLLRVRL